MQDLRHDYKSPTPATVGALAGQFSNQQIDATNKATDVTIGTIYDGLAKVGNTFTVSNANGLEAMPSMIEALPISSQGIINIDADIDFSGKVWTRSNSPLQMEKAAHGCVRLTGTAILSKISTCRARPCLWIMPVMA